MTFEANKISEIKLHSRMYLSRNWSLANGSDGTHAMFLVKTNLLLGQYRIKVVIRKLHYILSLLASIQIRKPQKPAFHLKFVCPYVKTVAAKSLEFEE